MRSLALPLPVVSLPSVARLRQVGLITLGWTLTTTGLLLVPVPGPFTLPLVLAGGVLLLRHSHDARRLYIKARRRTPPRLRPLADRFEALLRGRHPRRRVRT